uniref:Hypothetical chloroplast RF21 n=1 Tax=Cyathodium smaragdinum TaxID=2846787 RepID=A0A8F3BEE1_9MARC|nr:hypothetical chloroplast RF21 [Cyathodium smaragdinum]
MKRELPKKKSLYQNLYLTELREAQKSNPWTQWSLIKLLIEFISNKQHLSILFDFQNLTLLFSYSLGDYGKKKVLLNILSLSISPLSIYILNIKNDIGHKNLDSIKIQKHNFYKENDIRTSNKKFDFLNTKFDIILHNSSSPNSKKFYCMEKNRNQNLWKIIILDQIQSDSNLSKRSLSKIETLLEEKNIDDLKSFFKPYTNQKLQQNQICEYDSYPSFSDRSDKKFFDDNSNTKTIPFEFISAFREKPLFEIKNSEQFFFEKFIYLNILHENILNNLQSFERSKKKVVEFYFSVRNKKNAYFSNYTEFVICQSYKIDYLDTGRESLVKNFIEFDKFNNFEIFSKLEDFYSDYIYKFSKYLLCERRNYNKKLSNSFLAQSLSRKWRFFLDLNTDFFSDPNYDGIKKKFYFVLKPFLKSRIVDCIKTENYSEKNIVLISKFQHVIDFIISVNNPFINNRKKNTFFVDSERITKFKKINFTVLCETINYPKKKIIQFYFLTNSAYDMIGLDDEKNKILSKFFYFSYFISYQYKKLSIFFHFYDLRKILRQKNKLTLIFLKIEKKIDEKRLNKNIYFIIENGDSGVEKNFDGKTLVKTMNFEILFIKKMTELLRKPHLQKKVLIDKNFITWKKIVPQLFFPHTKYTQSGSDRKNIQVFFLDRKNIFIFSGKKIHNYNTINFYSLRRKGLKYKGINPIFNHLSVPSRTKNEDLNKIEFYKTFYFINEDSTTTFSPNNKNSKIFFFKLFTSNNRNLIEIFKKSFHSCISLNQNFFFDSPRDKQLLQGILEKINFVTFTYLLQITRLNYNNRFLFFSRKKNVNNLKLLYLRFFMFPLAKKNHFYINKSESSIGKKYRNFFIYSKLSGVSSVDGLKDGVRTNEIIPTKLYDSFSTNCKNINILLNNKYDFGKNSLKKEKFNNFVEKESRLNINNIYIRFYYDILFSRSFDDFRGRDYRIIKWINQFVFYSKNMNYRINERIGKRNKSIFLYGDDEKKLTKFFSKKTLFETHNSWFFTSGWWEYNIYILLQFYQESFYKIKNFWGYSKGRGNKFLEKIFIVFSDYNKNYFRDSYLNNLKLKWSARFYNEIHYNQNNFLIFSWFNPIFVDHSNTLSWVSFTLVLFISVYHKKIFSFSIGSDFSFSWKNLETINYLIDSSRNFYFTKISRHDRIMATKTENFLTYFLNNLIYYITNIKFYLLTRRKLKTWLINNKSLDLSRRKRKLLVQCLITCNKIQKYRLNINFDEKKFQSYFSYQITSQQGLLYFKYLARILKKNLIDDSFSSANKWISFAFHQKVVYAKTLWPIKKFDSEFQDIPVSLQFGLSYSKGILLVGPIETGKSYLIGNLSAEAYTPLFKISINKLLYNKPDIITESWMNILIESLRRLNLTLDFAEKMSPCIIWIQNIHQLNVNRLTQNVESDPTFLLSILLKYFEKSFSGERKNNNILIIGSTDSPAKVDPALISPNRSDKIINIRLFHLSQRRKQICVILKKKRFLLEKKSFLFSDSGSQTMGYNLRDSISLTNEILLINITKNRSFIDSNILKLAFHRHIFGLTYTNNRLSFEKIIHRIVYRIGKTIIQNILIKNFSNNFLNIGNSLWKKNYYYLSEWYLEASDNESIIKELTILTHILGCLAGTAAQDSYVLSKHRDKNSFPIDKLVENDFTLAFSISENFFHEFPYTEILRVNKKNCLNIMKNGIFSIVNRNFDYTQNFLQQSIQDFHQVNLDKQKSYEFEETYWSPRFWRLNFFRNHLFDWIKRPNDFETCSKLQFSKKIFFISSDNSKNNDFGHSMGEKKEQFLYERILPRIRKRNVQELEFQFEKILLEEQFEILGFFQSSTEFPMEYKLDDKPRLFIGKRILWNPIGFFSKIRHSVFSYRDFFVDEEMLRRLYVTYGARRERERSRSSNKIKQFFNYRGYKKDLISKLSIRWWNRLPSNEKQNINLLKHIEHIGIQLKRPQIFTPVYSYQRWSIENSPEKFFRFELLIHKKKWLKLNGLLSNDSSVYTTLLEIYQYLIRFFLINQKLLKQMTKFLSKKGWLFENEIEKIIYQTKN